MTDITTMMREQAKAGLQVQLDNAVTNGDAEAARKITDQIAQLAVQTAPKAPPYSDAEIRAHLEKVEWFGVDPKKSAKAIEFGKTLDPKKFSTAEAFATALKKAVDDEFEPPAKNEPKSENEPDPENEPGEKEKKAKRKSDGPGENDSGNSAQRRTSGPWEKLSDAPSDVQKEIKRQADKFVSANAPKEQREKFIKIALGSHYESHQRAKGKK